jgi:hypothetical protein
MGGRVGNIIIQIEFFIRGNIMGYILFVVMIFAAVICAMVKKENK